MPRYQYPGVYLEEVETEAHAIPGVEPSITYPGVYLEELPTEPHAIPGVATSVDACTKEEPLQRPHFFSGRLLDAATLQREQDYHREKLRRHVLAAHGFGIVWGLGVSVDSKSEPSGSRVIVAPGVAFDPRGEQVALPCGAAFAAPKDGDDAYVALRFWEHPASMAVPSEGDCPTFDYIEEACLVGVKTELSSPWVALARLTRAGESWSVDPTFEPPRVR